MLIQIPGEQIGFDGLNALIHKERMPKVMFQKIINWEIGEEIGVLHKRRPYNEIKTGQAKIVGMQEFKDDNGNIYLIVHIWDGADYVLKYYQYSGGVYGALTAITNDKRTAGSTIGQGRLWPLVFRNELRSGAGVIDDTKIPFWLGYIAVRNRYPDPTDDSYGKTISAGLYLCDQFTADDLKSDMLADPSLLQGVGSNTNSSGGFNSTDGAYMYSIISPLIDDYQRGFPQVLWPYNDNNVPYNVLYTYTYIEIAFKISDADADKLPRLTAFDIFLAQTNKRKVKIGEDTAYFAGRIKLGENSDFILTKSGTLDNTGGSEKITIASASDWHTFPLNEMWCYDETNDKYYLIDTDTDNAGDRELTVRTEGDAITDSGAATLHFFFGWFNSGGYYYYYFKVDNFYVQVGTEMFAYLNLPVGDLGIDDKKHIWNAWNGNRRTIGCSGNLVYYSQADAPDIFPDGNQLRTRYNHTAGSNLGRDFIIFSRQHAEYLRIIDNANAYMDNQMLNRGAISQQAVAKISDYVLAICDDKGPYILGPGGDQDIGEFLNDWFKDQSGILTKPQKDTIVLAYNFLKDQIWVSVPDYSDSYYTDGILFIYDRRAARRGFQSPWWILKTDQPLDYFTLNSLLHLLAVNKDTTSNILDFNDTGSTETVDAILKLKLYQNPLLGKQTRWNRLAIKYTSDDSATVRVYYDGSSSPTTLTLNTKKETLIKYLAETFEAEIVAPGSVNTFQFDGIEFDMVPKAL